MGRKDTLSTEYLSDNARFADICNYCLFDGQDVIQAEDLREMDTKEFLELAGLSGRGQQIQRIRDILKGAVCDPQHRRLHIPDPGSGESDGDPLCHAGSWDDL